MEYQIDKPIDVIFMAIEDLLELAEISGRPFTPQQIVNIGYLIVSKHRIFRSDIRKLLHQAIVNQTWPEFKTFFLEVHQELRDTYTSVDELGFYSTNTIVEQIVNQLRQETAVDNLSLTYNPPSSQSSSR